MKKRLLAALLSAAMLCTGGISALAAETAGDAAVSTEAPRGAVGEMATVLEMQAKSGAYSTLTVKTDTYDQIVLHFSANTVLMDTQSGFIANETDIKKGDAVYVYYDDTVMESDPPQSNAQAVLVNLDDNHAPARLLTAENIILSTDRGPTIEAENGTMLVTLPADVDIRPLATKNVASISDIHVGTRFFAWYDVVALSMPGQATATKVVLLPQIDYDITVVQGDIAIAPGAVKNGVAMAPVRKTAETLGFTVTWDGAGKSVLLSNGKIESSVKIGTDSYYYKSAQAIGMTQPKSLGAAAYIKDGVSYVPAELFTMLGTPVVLRGSALFLGGAQGAEIINPVVEQDSAKALADIGLPIDAPKDAKDVKYFIIDGDLAQVTFTLNGEQYTYRASKSEEDNSGVYAEYTKTDKVAVGDINVFIKTVADEGGYVAIWNRAGTQYSLSLLEKSDAAAFTALIKTLVA